MGLATGVGNTQAGHRGGGSGQRVVRGSIVRNGFAPGACAECTAGRKLQTQNGLLAKAGMLHAFADVP